MSVYRLIHVCLSCLVGWLLNWWLVLIHARQCFPSCDTVPHDTHYMCDTNNSYRGCVVPFSSSEQDSNEDGDSARISSSSPSSSTRPTPVKKRADRMLHCFDATTENSHVVVLCRNQFFYFDVLTKDGTSIALSHTQLVKQLERIVEHAATRERSPHGSAPPGTYELFYCNWMDGMLLQIFIVCRGCIPKIYR
jgi:hypothetical protein